MLVNLRWLSTGTYAALMWSLRWLALVGAAVTAAGSENAGSGLWTVLLPYLVGQLIFAFSYIRRWHRMRVALSLTVLDVVIPTLIVLTGGAWNSPFVWMLALPLMTLSISLGPWAACAVGIGISTAVTASHQYFTPGGMGIEIGAAAIAAALLVAFVGGQARLLAERMPAFGLQPAKGHDEDRRQRRDHRLSAGLTATLNFEHLVRLVLDAGVGVLETRVEREYLASALLLHHDDKLRVEAVQGLDTRLAGSIWEIDGGPISRALASTEIVQCSLDEEPGLRSQLGVPDWEGSAACIPLVSDIRELGAVIYLWKQRSELTGYQLTSLEAIAREAVIALQNAQLYRDLSREKERLDEIQEEARRKLARDLHDGPTQTIAAIAMRTNFARRQVSRDPESAEVELGKVEDMARRTTKEIRHLLFTLRPLILESQGLGAALVELADKARDTHDLKVLVEIEPGTAAAINPDKQGALFYIAEEAVNNARKHAAAENVWIRFKVEGPEVVLEVKDDGVGFNVGAVDATYAQRGSLGMVTMRERAELVDGAFRLQSSEGQGTRIEVRVPVDQRAPGGPIRSQTDIMESDGSPV